MRCITRDEKCVCGYKYSEYYNPKRKVWVVTEGCEYFPSVDITAYMAKDFDGGIERIQVIACPECGTLKIES